MSTTLEKSRKRVAAFLFGAVLVGGGGIAAAAAGGIGHHTTPVTTSTAPAAGTTTTPVAPTSTPAPAGAPVQAGTAPGTTPNPTPTTVPPAVHQPVVPGGSPTYPSSPPVATTAPTGTGTATPTTTPNKVETVPNLVGMTVAQAEGSFPVGTWAVRTGTCTVVSTGSDQVITSQSPAAGTVVTGPGYDWPQYDGITVNYQAVQGPAMGSGGTFQSTNPCTGAVEG